MKRRALISGLAAIPLCLPAGRLLAGVGRHPRKALERLAVTTVSLRDRYPASYMAKKPGVNAPSLLEAPSFVSKTLGLRNIELWNLQFEDIGDAYIRRMRAAADAAGVRIINIQIDDDSNLSSPDNEVRARSIAQTKAWIDRAVILGAPSVRQNLGPADDNGPFNVERTADSFRQIAQYAASRGVKILAENHVGQSRSIPNVVALLQAVNHPACRAIADWGNTPASSTAELLAALKPLALWLALVSAKGKAFDSAYHETSYDVAELTRVTESWGFRGLYSVELWGDTPPDFKPVLACRSMVDVILKAVAEHRS